MLSLDEVRRVMLAVPPGEFRILAGLMYGAGMRLLEGCREKGRDGATPFVRFAAVQFGVGKIANRR